MLNPIFWKEVQGQKHPGRWGIVEHQIPSIKVLFKTNTKSHKHPGIKLLSSESKTQLVNQRKQKVAFNPGTAHSPEIQSYRMWWGAASPKLNDTPVVCIYTSYNSFWTGTKVIRRKHIIQPTGFGDCSSTCCQWDGEDAPGQFHEAQMDGGTDRWTEGWTQTNISPTTSLCRGITTGKMVFWWPNGTKK